MNKKREEGGWDGGEGSPGRRSVIISELSGV